MYDKLCIIMYKTLYTKHNIMYKKILNKTTNAFFVVYLQSKNLFSLFEK